LNYPQNPQNPKHRNASLIPMDHLQHLVQSPRRRRGVWHGGNLNICGRPSANQYPYGHGGGIRAHHSMYLVGDRGRFIPFQSTMYRVSIVTQPSKVCIPCVSQNFFCVFRVRGIHTSLMSGDNATNPKHMAVWTTIFPTLSLHQHPKGRVCFGFPPWNNHVCRHCRAA
jgi:hypothetical protein